MIPSNSYYGHSAILRAAAGVRSGRVQGYVQHGWELGSGLPRGVRTIKSANYFLWSNRNLDRTTPDQRTRSTAIGAPFLYLDPPASEPARIRKTICYPFHASEWDPVKGSHGDLVSELADRYGSSNTTICLYWLEWQDLRVRRMYEQAGFRVICHGFREDPLFLSRLQSELLAHGTVVSNRVSTALFYGGILGRRIEIAGPMWTIRGRSREDSMSKVLSDEFPALVTTGLGPNLARELAADELGLAHRRDPDELRELLGWTGASRRFEPLQTVRVRAAHYGRSMIAQAQER